MLKKILVTGANGQVGKEIHLLSKNFPAIEFLFAAHSELDISDKNSVEKYFMEHQPQCVINCAAYTAVDKAESEPDAA
ncbi:MAG TPA: NAD(P)-dependent oxidoreductase, partial [Bacteroidetes bacterium]|nr:NAD(P)-dependent oxidoreductase [Bacteroidota bacterium]